MPASTPIQSDPCPDPMDIRSAARGLTGSLLVIAVVLATATSAGYCLAIRAGMAEDHFVCDMIVANASIVIHLTLERCLHHVARSARCLAGHLLSAIRRPFGSA